MNINTMKLFRLKDAVEILGVPYYRLWRAVDSGIVAPIRVGTMHLLTDKNIQELRKHFEAKQKGRNERS
ncbi:hypothetical protein CA11_53180 [Gimesia maris]|uniref:hypothetical protein n=1 Tax=Gimesia maris TaxID=122 RepID=UPI00118A3BDE|nr:hypothetical protein [Gimesia maris]QDU17476.1 hypothetical protein CA11_53180 [Gimesia maris]